ncbi:MAG: phosphopantetheine-binding protein [Bdellovibrionota bacterium]
MRSENELFAAVQESICTVLDMDADEVKASSKIVEDLGAESIDFLDISCELEKAIKYELDFKEIFSSKSENGDSSPNDVSVEEIVKFLQSKNI